MGDELDRGQAASVDLLGSVARQAIVDRHGLVMRAATAVPSQRLVWHWLEMLLAMAAGMLLLAPVGEILWSTPPDRVELHAVKMAGTMTAGMVVWCVLRHRTGIALTAMVAAMWLPYLLLGVPYVLGAVEGDVLTTGGHVLMLPSMYLALRATTRPGSGSRRA